jgi:phage terminase small subunit
MDRREGWLSILADDGPVLFTDKGYAYQHPIVGALHTLEHDLFAALSLLGFTPSDRSRLGVAEVTAQSKLEQIRASQGK